MTTALIRNINTFFLKKLFPEHKKNNRQNTRLRIFRKSYINGSFENTLWFTYLHNHKQLNIYKT